MVAMATPRQGDNTVGGLRGGCGGVVLRGVLVRRTESIGIH